jgi:hypothetical protein
VRQGLVRQTFSAAVLEHQAGAARARLAEVGPVLTDAGVVPTRAQARQASPWGGGPRAHEPSGIGWLLVAVGLVLAGWLVMLVIGIRRARRRSSPERTRSFEWDYASEPMKSDELIGSENIG